MKSNLWIISILTIVIGSLFVDCNKSKVAQVNFSAKLDKTTAEFPRIIGIDTTKSFKIAITILLTEKVSALYPKAEFYLKYQMIDKDGNQRKGVDLHSVIKNPNITNVNPFPQDTLRKIGFTNTLMIINREYHIVGKTADFLSSPSYRIVFSLLVKDSLGGDSLVNVPSISPKEAKRILEVTIDTTNTNNASYILSYNKNPIYFNESLKKQVYAFFIKNENDRIAKYLKIIG